ncbi:MAG: hypothetical protein P4L99_19910 [Chthoniobacter sp.]|nr:hypothetical protein [Chthoniobacter sp.]
MTNIHFVAGEHRFDYGLGQILDELEKHGLLPTEDALDLALLAMLVFCADTRISRKGTSQDGWTREIDLYLPVSDVAKWDGMQRSLIDGLKFLTGDRWRIFVRKRPAGFSKCLKKQLQGQLPQFSCVSLFSGGLDSFIGAVDLLTDKESPLFVSHYWDGMTSEHQNVCIHVLERQFPHGVFDNIRARVGFENDLVEHGGREDTQRSRSFLFLALGALTGSSLRKDTTLYVPENGLISLNVPLDYLRVGAQSTRTTHPYFMARFQELLRSLNIPVTLKNPYQFQTKGEMVLGCKDIPFLRKNAKHTISCSSETKGRWKGLKPMHCGYCVPCLIRRASLRRGLKSDDTPYQIEDLRERPLNSAKAEGRDVRSFQLALSRLRQFPGFSKIAVMIPGPLTEFKDELPAFAEMYERGLQEVGDLLKRVVARPL